MSTLLDHLLQLDPARWADCTAEDRTQATRNVRPLFRPLPALAPRADWRIPANITLPALPAQLETTS